MYTQLRAFHAVAKHNGFTAAATALRVGQPTITTQVRALEDYYGVELFHRRGRSVSLTDAGRGLYAITQRLLSQETEARDYLNAVSGFHTGHLNLGAVGPYHVTEMISLFHERFPKLKISLSLGNSQDMLERLADFQVDVAVLAYTGDDPRFLVLPYRQNELVIFLRRDHPLAKKGKVYMADLADQSLVLREQGSTTRRAFDAAAEAAGVQLEPTIEMGSREAIWFAVQKGLGLGVVSQAEFVAHEDLTTLHLVDAKITTGDDVVCLKERQENPMVQAFLKVARDLIGR
ncbi:MAG: LysR substrate-binding domain-containing protein [Pseudomonadota bacterium]